MKNNNNPIQNRNMKINNETKYYPLTQNQLGIYYDILENPFSTVYNISLVVHFKRNIDIENLKDSIIKTIKAHPYLNTRLFNIDSNIYQKEVKIKNIEIPIKNEKFTDSILKSFIKPFDLFNEALYRFEIYNDEEDGENDVYLLLDINHMIFDAYSFNIFMDDLLKAYNGKKLANEKFNAYDYALEEINNENSAKYNISYEYYKDKFLNFEGQTKIPYDKVKHEPNNKDQSDGSSSENIQGNEKSEILKVDKKLIENFCKEVNVRPSGFFLAALNLTINKFTYDNSAMIATISNNRHDEKYKKTIAMMVNTLPLVLKTNSDLTIEEYLLNTWDDFKEILNKQDYPLSKIADEFKIRPEICYAYRDKLIKEQDDISIDLIDPDISQFPLSLDVYSENTDFILDLKYDSFLYSKSLMESFITSMKSIVISFTKNKTNHIKDISIIPKNISFDFKDIGNDLPIDLFKKQVKNNPNKIALIANKKKFTYKDLDEKSDIIANNLIQKGLNIEDKIVIALKRDCNLIATILASIKSGACFIPVDPNYPEERVNYILNDSKSKFIITDYSSPSLENNKNNENNKDNYSEWVNIKDLLENNNYNYNYNNTKSNKHINNNINPLKLSDIKLNKNNLIYMIYTSGSTGNPKGAMITHGSMANYVNCDYDSNIEAVAIKDSSIILATTTVSFDPFYQEIFTPLFNGGTCVLADDKQAKNPIELIKLYRETKFKSFTTTPSILLQFLSVDAFNEVLNNIDSIIIGGEAFPPLLWDKLKKYPNLKIYNSYGPTETTISCNSKLLSYEDSSIKIGNPMLNVIEEIIDIDGNILPNGAIGELLIGGYCVGRGYWQRADITQEKFIEINGYKFFKSGDLAIRDSNGEYKIIGRIDNQVKLRGQRIETEEIEKAINLNNFVNQSFVKVDNIEGDDYLIAYTKFIEQIDNDYGNDNYDNNSQLKIAIKEEISKKLPEYMVPKVFIEIDTFPYLPSGKIDTNSLPTPTIEDFLIEEIIDPTTENEKKLYYIVAETLKHENFGITTNLLSAGFTSLSIIQILTKISKEFSVDLDLVKMLRNATIEKIVTLIENSSTKNIKSTKRNKPTKAAKAPNKEISEEYMKDMEIKTEYGYYSLCNNQLGIFYELLDKPNSTVYNIPSVVNFKEAIDVNKLKLAIIETINAHQYLNTRLVKEDGEIYQKNFPNDFKEENDIKIFDKPLNNEIKKEFVKPYDLFNEYLYRFAIYKDKKNTYLLTDFNHIIFDGISHNIFFRDLFINYNNLIDHNNSETDINTNSDNNKIDLEYKKIIINNDSTNIIEKEEFSGYDLAIEEEQLKDSIKYKDAEEFFKNKMEFFEGVSEISPQFINEDSSNQDSIINNFSNKNSSDFNDLNDNPSESNQYMNINKENILNLAKQLNVTPNIIFLAAANLTINKFTYNHDTIIATISNGRNSTKYMNTIAMMVKTFVLSLHTNSNLNISQYLLHINDTYLNTLEYDFYPISTVVEKYDIKPEILYAYQGDINETYKNVSFEDLEIDSAKFKFSLNIFEEKESFKINIGYYDKLYSEKYIKTFLDSLKIIIGELSKNQKKLIKDISISKSAEEISNNFTPKPVQEQLLNKIFEKSVNENSEKIAVMAEDGDLTYNELNKRANKIANGLIKKGVKVEDKIMFMLKRNNDLISTVLGIIKAGCTFIPIDPEYPIDRINHVMSDSESKFIITNSSSDDSNLANSNIDNTIKANNLDKLGKLENKLNIDDLLKEKDESNPNPNLIPSNSAYIIYTSGSTGKPKGVILSHNNISNYVYPSKENVYAYGLKEKANRLLSIVTVAFDVFLHDIFLTLMNGLTVVFSNDESSKDPIKLVKLFKKTKADAFSITPSRMNHYLEFDEFKKVLKYCKVISVAGEKYPLKLHKTLEKATDAEIYNVYGPTETTISSNTKHIVKDYITVGKPLLNVVEMVADIDGNPLPQGIMGELYIGGTGVSKGYLNREKLTKERFINIEDVNYYKSGDFAIEDKNGEYIIIGRMDNQIKLRGLRIEIGEIENIINNYPNIKESVVLIKEVKSNEHLCAYLRCDEAIDIDDLKVNLRKKLIPYMIPSYFIPLEEFPMTPNGKTDIKELPEPDEKSSDQIDTNISQKQLSPNNIPNNVVEEGILDIISEILGYDKFRVNDDLFQIGFTSLSILKLMVKISEKYNIEITLANIMENRTIKNIANQIINSTFSNLLNDTQLKETEPVSKEKIKLSLTSEKNINENLTSAPEEKINESINTNVQCKKEELNKSKEKIVLDYNNYQLYPLTQNQLGIYLDCVKNPEKLIYNIPFAVSFDKNINVNKLIKALNKSISNHPYIMTKLVEMNGQVYQLKNKLINNDLDNNTNVNTNKNTNTNINSKTNSNTNANTYNTTNNDDNLNNDSYIDIAIVNGKVTEKVKKDFVKPFKLLNNHLCRFKIYQNEENVTLLVDFHHIISDGYSLNLLFNDIKKTYSNEPLAIEKYSGFDLSVKEKEFENSKLYREAELYYKNKLKDFDGEQLISPDKNDDESTGNVMYSSIATSKDRIDEYCKNNHLSQNTLFLSATTLALSKFVFNRDILLFALFNGRDDINYSNTFGMMVKTIPIISKIDSETTIEEYLKNMGENYLKLIKYSSYPSTKLIEEYDIKPEFIYSYQGQMFDDLEIEGTKFKLESLELDSTKSKLGIQVEEKQNEFVISTEYNDALYSKDLIDLFLDSIKSIIQQIINNEKNDPNEANSYSKSKKSNKNKNFLLKDITLLSKEELNLIDKNIPLNPIKEQVLNKVFEQQVEKNKDKIALIAEDGEFTYDELNKKANKIANALIKRGTNIEDKVMLMVRRDSSLIASILGIIKAGCVYIPIDPEYPTDRIAHVMEDSESKFIITDKDLPNKISPDELLTEPNDENPNIQISPKNLAYIIYTSGSTGKPKGVMITHEGITNLIYPAKENIFTYDLVNKSSKLLSVITVAFDPSLNDYFNVLMNGLTLIFANDEEAKDPIALSKLFAKTQPDAFSLTPARLLQYLEFKGIQEGLKNCKVLILGGEPYSFKLHETIIKYSATAIFNEYGPTEITIACNGKRVQDHDKIITVGKPLFNVKELILDIDNNPLPQGIVGELAVGGLGVSKGYLNREELNKEKFIKIGENVYYKTGDFAKCEKNGEYSILGRMDNQIKLRGLRIEIGEIESKINEYNNIKSSLVIIKTINDQEHLCAYITAHQNIDTDDLKAEISQHLVPYMVPSIFIQMDEFPQSPNGKIDMKALPDAKIPINNYIAPKTKDEEVFIEIFENILKTKKIGSKDNFFMLGGTSLLATKVVVEGVKKGYTISYEDVFKHQTPQKIADAVTNNKMSNTKINNSEVIHSEINNKIVNNRIIDDEIIIEKEKIVEDTFNNLDDSIQSTSSTTHITDSLNINDKFKDILKLKNLENFADEKIEDLGNVLLTGTTGFLGIHILQEFLENESGDIYCLLRKGRQSDVEKRLKTLLFYYFNDNYEELINKRIHLIEGDVTDSSDFDKCLKYPIDTVINTAANVKHFSHGSDIEDVNIGGVINSVNFCKEKNSKLIHVSTVSIAGMSIDNFPSTDIKFDESMLYINQNLNNKYINSKFKGEEIILESILNGEIDAKIMRVGNLMARDEDSEFQINFNTNSFINQLKSHYIVGSIPYKMMNETVEFSPIDSTAKSILALSKTPKEYIVFHPYNNHNVTMGDIITVMNKLDLNIKGSSLKNFNDDLMNTMEDEEKITKISGMISLLNTTEIPISSINEYTTELLYHLGFNWNIITGEYLYMFIKHLKDMNFFE